MNGGITISIFENIDYLKPIGMNALQEVESFFELVDYEACEYNFTTLYMWQSVYNFHFATNPNFMAVFGEKDGNLFAIQPFCKSEFLKQAMDYIDEVFKSVNQKIQFKAVTEEILEQIKILYPNKFTWETHRDDCDYIYDAEKLRTLAGKKMHSKKNHYNAFLKEYGDRFIYKRLSKNEFQDCIKLAEKWAFSREKDQNLIGESLAIKKVFKNYSQFKNLKVSGIYIDNNLEAFTFGDYLNSDMALIHIEKANPDIRGLYAAINKLFMENEFPDVEFANREDDLGIEGLRTAKLSYKPIKLVDKYSLFEV